MGRCGLGQHRSLHERGIIFCLCLLSFSFSLSPFPLPTPSQQSSNSHYLLTKPSQLLRAPPFYGEGSGEEARTRKECAWRLPSPSPERPAAGISPLSPRPPLSVYIPREQLSPRQLAGELTFLPWPRCSICPQIGSQTPSPPNGCQFIKWEHVAQKSPESPGEECVTTRGRLGPGLGTWDGSLSPAAVNLTL